MARSSNAHGCSDMHGGGDMHGRRQYTRWRRQHARLQTTRTARSSDFTAAVRVFSFFLFLFFTNFFFSITMTVLWAQERHARPTAATRMATDDTRGSGGNIHGCRRHAPRQRQHLRPQTMRMAAAVIRAACSSNAHGRSDLHGGGDNTHGHR
jgi:hypothetical protein